MDEHDERSTSPSHDAGTRKAEEMGGGSDEAGREDTGTTETGRPTGSVTGRYSTGINPDAENPIDPESPEMPPP